MRSFVIKVCAASVALSTLIGAEAAYAYSNVTAGSYPGETPAEVSGAAEPAPTAAPRIGGKPHAASFRGRKPHRR